MQSPELGALRRELGTHWLLRRALHHFQQRYSQLVTCGCFGPANRRGDQNRDESARLLWNVVDTQPVLVLAARPLMGQAERCIRV